MTAKRRTGHRQTPAGPRAMAPRDYLLPTLVLLTGWSSYLSLPFVTGSNTGRVIAVLICGGLWLSAWAFGFLPLLGKTGRRTQLVLLASTVTVLVASAFSPYAERALTWGSIGFFGAPLWVALLLILWASGHLSITRDRRWWIAGAVAWAVPSLAVAASEVARSVPVAGGFNTGNHFSAMMVALAPVFLWLGSASESSAQRIVGYALAGACVAAVIVANSAAGSLGLVAAGVVIVAVSPTSVGARTPGAVRMLRLSTGAIVGLAAILLVAAAANMAAVPASVRDIVQQDVLGPTFTTRVEMWRASARIFAERPVFGVGADGFHLAAQPHLSERLFATEQATGVLASPPDPHSLPVLVAVSFGLVGLIALLALATQWLLATFRRRDTEPPDAREARLCCAASTVGFFVALSFLPWAAIMGGFPLLIAGIAAADPDSVTRGESTPFLLRAAGVVAAIVLVALALLLLTGLWRIDRAVNSSSARAAIAEYSAAGRLLPTYPYSRFMALHAEGQRLGGSPDAVADWQRRVDADTRIHGDATYSLLLLRDALDQAYRWGRSELSWERTLLEQAGQQFPNAPDRDLEHAHLLLLEGQLDEAGRILDGLQYLAAVETRVGLYRYYLVVAQGNSAEAALLRSELEAEYGPLQLLEPQQNVSQ